MEAHQETKLYLQHMRRENLSLAVKYTDMKNDVLVEFKAFQRL